MRQIARLASIALPAIVLASCFSPQAPAGPSAHPSASATSSGLSSPSPTSSASAIPLPSPLANYGSALQASVYGAQKLAAQRHQVYVEGDTCPAERSCIHGPAQEHDGDRAAYVIYRSTGATGAGPGPYDCFVYVYQEGWGWHSLDGYCTQELSASIGATNYIATAGSCANIRETPALTAKVSQCLSDRTRVTIDGGPSWRDGHIWWHLTDRGWTAHDNIFPGFAATSLTCIPVPCWVTEAP
jgi:hypothetical protein